jgi:hypothetical protein
MALVGPALALLHSHCEKRLLDDDSKAARLILGLLDLCGYGFALGYLLKGTRFLGVGSWATDCVVVRSDRKPALRVGLMLLFALFKIS